MTDRLNSASTALLIYDMAEEHVAAGRVPKGMPDLVTLLQYCRRAGVLVCYANGGHGGVDIPSAIAPLPHEPALIHPESGAFPGTDLRNILNERRRHTLIVAGTAIDRGCNTTARQALSLGLHVVMPRGACYTYDIVDSPVGRVSKEDIERVHLAALFRMGAAIMTVDEIIAQILP